MFETELWDSLLSDTEDLYSELANTTLPWSSTGSSTFTSSFTSSLISGTIPRLFYPYSKMFWSICWFLISMSSRSSGFIVMEGLTCFLLLSFNKYSTNSKHVWSWIVGFKYCWTLPSLSTTHRQKFQGNLSIKFGSLLLISSFVFALRY